MRQFENYGDTRQVAACAYCRDATETRDHVPARVLLDEPFPENLPVVPACLDCNNSASADEEYLACLIECVIQGTTEPAILGREKIRRLLTERPALQAKLTAAHRQDQQKSVFSVELERIERVVVKLARGHSLYELNEPRPSVPSSVTIAPLHLFGDEAREAFECTTEYGFAVWPEVGSRAMQRLIQHGQEWIEVQPSRYRYLATVDATVRVRIVLSEYLACEVIWVD
jgi:hypothetical protein